MSADSITSSASSPSWVYDYGLEHGEGLGEIASRFQVSQEQLIEANRDSQPQLAEHPDRLMRGTLKIPMGEGAGVMPRSVTLSEGQTLQDLAQQTHMPLWQLRSANRHELNAERTVVGKESVWVPGKRPPPQEPAAKPATPTPAQTAAAGEASATGAASESDAASGTGTAAAPKTTGQAAPALAQPPALSLSAGTSAHASERSTGIGVRLDARYRLNASTTLSAGIQPMLNVPDQGTTTLTPRLSLGVAKSLSLPGGVNGALNVGTAVWPVVNLQSGNAIEPTKGYNNTLVFPSMDLSANRPLGDHLQLRARVGAVGAIDPVNATRTTFLSAQAGASLRLGELTITNDVRLQKENRLNADDLRYGINMLDVRMPVTDKVSLFGSHNHTFGKDEPTPPWADSPHGRDRVSLGVTVQLP